MSVQLAGDGPSITATGDGADIAIVGDGVTVGGVASTTAITLTVQTGGVISASIIGTGIVSGDTPPTNGDVLWLDTSATSGSFGGVIVLEASQDPATDVPAGTAPGTIILQRRGV